MTAANTEFINNNGTNGNARKITIKKEKLNQLNVNGFNFVNRFILKHRL